MASVMPASDAVLPTRKPGVRRLSTLTVVPPKQSLPSKDAHETAATLGRAKHNLDDTSSGATTPITPAETTVTDSYAFAFDIDGVLIRGGKVIPEAVEAMKVLNGENEYGIEV